MQLAKNIHIRMRKDPSISKEKRKEDPLCVGEKKELSCVVGHHHPVQRMMMILPHVGSLIFPGTQSSNHHHIQCVLSNFYILVGQTPAG